MTIREIVCGLIAGNGKFPFLVIEGARKAGASVAVAAIREETDPEIERAAESVTWVGLGQLGKMLRFFKNEGVEKAIMAGQVKHVQIFSGAIPDVRMLKMLLRLPKRNTDALIGAVADELAAEGIELIDSTFFLKDQLPQTGILTKRAPDERERGDIEYGLEIAREIARLDLGQTIVIRDVGGAQGDLEPLVTLIQGFNINRGLANSFIAKVRAARASAQRGDMTSACGQMAAFLKERNLRWREGGLQPGQIRFRQQKIIAIQNQPDVRVGLAS